jgi:hypothetical protein
MKNILIKQDVPPMDKLPGGYIPDSCPDLEGGDPIMQTFPVQGYTQESLFVLHRALTNDDTASLIDFFNEASKKSSAQVSVSGFQVGDAHASVGGEVGSVRTTMWAPELADSMWKIINPYFGPRMMLYESSTDWWQSPGSSDLPPHSRHWAPVGCSPMMRFMRYESGGEHYPHYDAGYFYPGVDPKDDGKYRTLMSFVVYLTDNLSGGSTRIIKDKQRGLPVWERNHDDWDRRANEEEVLAKITPQAGKILVFDHRICHDVERFNPAHAGESRIIIRGDIVYKNLKIWNG